MNPDLFLKTKRSTNEKINEKKNLRSFLRFVRKKSKAKCKIIRKIPTQGKGTFVLNSKTNQYVSEHKTKEKNAWKRNVKKSVEICITKA